MLNKCRQSLLWPFSGSRTGGSWAGESLGACLGQALPAQAGIFPWWLGTGAWWPVVARAWAQGRRRPAVLPASAGNRLVQQKASRKLLKIWNARGVVHGRLVFYRYLCTEILQKRVVYLQIENSCAYRFLFWSLFAFRNRQLGKCNVVPLSSSHPTFSALIFFPLGWLLFHRYCRFDSAL